MNKKTVLGRSLNTINNPNGYKFNKIPNRNKNINYSVRISVPEFTSICPVTEQPDFANIIIDYVPKLHLVESKSFKIFIQLFRNYGIYHEDATLLIGTSLIKSLSPKWLRIAGFFAPRGGIPIDVFWQSGKLPQNTFIPDIKKGIMKINR